MGLLGTLLDKSKMWNTSFTISGDLNSIRSFIVERCTKKGYHFICNKEDAWLGDLEAKNGDVLVDTINQFRFQYVRKYQSFKIEFEGSSTGNGMVTIRIVYYADHAKSSVKTIQDSITKHFAKV